MTYLHDEIKNYISGRRYEHTLAVESECIKLAVIYNLGESDTYKLRIAALLHDITKEIELDGQLELCNKYNITYNSMLLKTPKLFHALTGAEVAKADFGRLVDDTVYNAIRCHSTGRENMNIIDKLLLLADYIDETRKFKDCVKLRKYFYNKVKSSNPLETLDNALIMSFDLTIKDLIKKNFLINIQTIKSRNYLLMNKSELFTNEQKTKNQET